ncbi:cell division cycle 14 [Lasallia pustulata]|uniref:protein-tyrosine-phosphatase n=1 Tax=Lasallia pustulata TaxID=136370 RepID=A0A1W5DDT2_9LECA|nr:cell division cycle 14 [Lasallia pustulata]
MIRRILPKGRAPHICVVGAGMAGMRCAQVLSDKGMKVTVFEGRDRLDAAKGPNWIHGTDHNPFIDLAEETDTTTFSVPEKSALFDEFGHPLPEDKAAQYSEVVWGMISDAFKYSNEHSASIPQTRSLRDYLEERVKDKGLTKAEERIVLQMAEMWGAFVGDPLERQSLKFFWLEECIEGENLFVASTYKSILSHIATTTLAHTTVHLSTKVMTIESLPPSPPTSPNPSVRVTTSTGTIHIFDEVIMTAPLGYLKRNLSTFVPPLPPRLTSAIANISYGRLEKVYITFPHAFWDSPPSSSSTPNGDLCPIYLTSHRLAFAATMPPPQTSPAQAAHAVSYGQVIEYIQDRIYLASYTHPPDEATPFPYPRATSRSPQKRSSKSQRGPTPAPVSTGPKVHPPVYFTIDDSLLYNAFHADFGPLHIGHLYRFAVTLHDYLGDPANEGRGVVFWSMADSRSRANAACLLACYMVLIQGWAPHLALAPIAQADPPLMPFRDAGYSQADYVLNVQDVVYGVWKAKEEGLCGLRDFSLEEYERFERVDMGDFNWLTPQFLAFASPQHPPIAPIPTSSPLYATLPTTLAAVKSSSLPQPFKNVLCHFSSRNIGLVVRLNSELYCPSYFTALGINHLDMIFDDGTCPPLALVKKFIKLAHETITTKHKAIAVHCKAGLGRTGCLIGAYLIYRHGFTANEIIAFMRFMRPGMVAPSANGGGKTA